MPSIYGMWVMSPFLYSQHLGRIPCQDCEHPIYSDSFARIPSPSLHCFAMVPFAHGEMDLAALILVPHMAAMWSNIFLKKSVASENLHQTHSNSSNNSFSVRPLWTRTFWGYPIFDWKPIFWGLLPHFHPICFCFPQFLTETNPSGDAPCTSQHRLVSTHPRFANPGHLKWNVSLVN